MKNRIIKMQQRGSMMVEALAMLGLITMVTPILYKKAAERTTELQDINTATQMRTLSKALDDYIQDNYAELADGPVGEAMIDGDEIVPYLPYNFNIDSSKLFGSYQFALRNELINEGEEGEHSAITGMVLAPLEGELPMIRAAKIASMVGANGGVVDKNRPDFNIMGVQGGWKANLDEFGFDEDVIDGSIVTASVHAVTSSGGGGAAASMEHVLYRDNSEGPEYNTMQTTLYMAENPIEGVDELVAGLTTGKISVDGGMDISADLTAENATINNSLGAGTATITGLLKAGSANIAEKFKVEDSGVTITADTGITGKTSIVGETTIDGTTTINDNVKVTDGGLLTASAGAVVSGTVSGETDDENTEYTLVSDGNLLVKNNANAHFTGDVKIDNDLIADSLYGNLELGGGKIADGEYNFLATESNVVIKQPNFEVGNMLSVLDDGTNKEVFINAAEDGSTNKLSLDADGLKYEQDDGTTNNLLEINSSGVALDSSGSIAMSGDIVTAKSSSMSASLGSAFNVGAYSEDGEGNVVESKKLAIDATSSVMYGDTAQIIGGQGTGVNTPKIELSNGNVYVTADETRINNSFVMNDNDIVFDAGELPTDNNPRASGVRISRQGIVDVAGGYVPEGGDNSKGRVNTPGYIRADRFISNKAYPDYVGDGDYKNSTGTTSPYDAYQVNPAYTSVMHDIKLTTRGGARLSDILPDFINKGIYVLDNTYKEEEGKKEWEKYTVKAISGGGFTVDSPSECDANDGDCIASPWLGFVPTPQCPPGYSKVITINPIRWKMAEAFYIPGLEPTATEVGKKFRDYFIPRTNPLNATFELENASGEGSHTHIVKSGWPLTFQTNTWLNTTISGVYGEKDVGSTAEGSGADGGQRKVAFLGWHSIMGFLYYASDYKDYLNKVGADFSQLDGKVVWNLFPVYNEEMTAIANVYCYFERRAMTSTPQWHWNPEIVDGGQAYNGYDQLINFRWGFDKNNELYNDRLNDPVLGYDEVW